MTTSVCAVCGHGLSLLGDPDNPDGFMHPTSVADDHPVVPVEPGEVPHRPLCDICSVEVSIDEVWTWPCDSFEESVGDWAMCPDCHEIAINGRWDEITRRGVEAGCRTHGEQMRPMIGQVLTTFHAKFRENLNGDPYKGTPPQYVYTPGGDH